MISFSKIITTIIYTSILLSFSNVIKIYASETESTTVSDDHETLQTNNLLKHQLRGRKSRINRTIAEREESLFMRFLEEALGPEVMSDDDTDGSPDSMEESASVVPPVLNPLNHIWFRTFLLLSTYILPLVCLPCLCSLQLLGFVFSPIPIVSSFFGFVAIMLVRFPLIFLYDDFIPTVLNEFFGDKV